MKQTYQQPAIHILQVYAECEYHELGTGSTVITDKPINNPPQPAKEYAWDEGDWDDEDFEDENDNVWRLY